MIEYNTSGFKCVYPDNLVKQDEFPAFQLSLPKNKYWLLMIFLVRKSTDYSVYYDRITPLRSQYPHEQASTNQDGKDINEIERDRICKDIDRPEIIRYGDFLKFPGAKENFSSRYGIYGWSLVIPVEDRLVMIEATGDSLDVIENIWAPIIDSMEFDASKFGLDMGEYKQEQADRLFLKKLHKWTNLAPGKSKSLKRSMCISFASMAFYDSDLDYNLAINFSKKEYTQGAYKQSRATTIFIHNLPALQLTVNLNKKAPADKNKSWDHIIEGVIAIDSGKMIVSNYDDEIKIALNPGNYKFRVYVGNLEPGLNEDEKCSIYLWETKEPETNDIKVIKQF